MHTIATFLTFALIIVCVYSYIKLMRKYNTTVYYIIGAAAILGGWLIMYDQIHTNMLITVKYLKWLIVIAPGWNF